MSGPWLASYVALWAVVLFQGAIIFLLLRQLGMMYLGTAQGVSRDGLAPGRPAPEFTATGLDGAAVTLAGFRGLPVLLVFGSASCGPCRTLIPELNVFARERSEELRVLFLCRGDLDEARRFAEEFDVEVPVAAHPDEALPTQYQARVTPFAFLVDGEGVIQAKGLANNREHLEMHVRAASERTAKGNAQAGRNGGSAESLATEEGHR